MIPAAESLEPRQLLSSSATIVRGQVRVVADDADNDIRIVRNSHTPAVRYTVVVDGHYTNFFVRQVHGFQISAAAGNDRVLVDSSNGSIRVTRSIDAGAGDDTITGSAGSDIVSGDDGDDVIITASGNDIVDGGAGDDTVSGGNDNDRIDGGLGNDSLIGGHGNDTLLGSDGSDSLSGNDGSDWLEGGAGDDTLLGAEGHDVLQGGAGNDYLDGAGDTDYLYGGAGDDTLFGQSGNDVLAGDEEDMMPTASVAPPGASAAGNDNLIGGDGNDMLLAQFGKDLLIGSGGTDVFDARGGDDTLVDRSNTEQIPATEVFLGNPARTQNVNLKVFIRGERVLFRRGMGGLSGGISLARIVATNPDGSATVRFSDLVKRRFTLGEFFRAWGVTLDSVHIGRYFASRAHPLTMTVNGVAQTSFSEYQINSGDRIVITYA